MTGGHRESQASAAESPHGGRDPRILIAVPEMCYGRDNVFESQVLGLARALVSLKRQVLVLASSSRDARAPVVASTASLSEGLSLVTVPAYPKTPHYFSVQSAVNCVMREAGPLLREYQPQIVYSRNPVGYRASRSLSRALRAQTVFDARALIFSEAAYRGRPFPLVLAVRTQERSAVRGAARVTCVSRALRDWIRAHFGRADLDVVPCCIDSNTLANAHGSRAAVREELGWPLDAPVIVYCGGLDQWQKIDDVLALMGKLLRARASMRALFLVSDPARLRELASRYRLRPDAYDVRRVPQRDVGKWLAACDFGVILRDDVLMNQVASPIKIAEYLAAGLTVVCTKNIGDLSELVVAEGVGISIDPNADTDDGGLLALIDALGDYSVRRSRAQAIARQYLDWSAHAGTLERLFSTPNT
ncbi:MAG: glycosyltransferase family 4 protein [Acidobacteria bacterium]|nr:glycosyltransferase family 4 protein [Acidobacteriota bacterium]